ncbi:MAG: MauE/DoxX family redox-associated membrane protein [Acidobacteriota bacterium]
MFGGVASVFLGAVLLVAVWGKLLAPGSFVEQIQLEGLDFMIPASTVALLALGLEAGLGTLLALGVRRPLILIPAAALVAFFLFLTGRNYWLVWQGVRDPSASCGCFGPLLDRTAAEAFWQDSLLLVPPLLVAFWTRPSPAGSLPGRRLGVGLAAALVAVAIGWRSPELRFTGAAARIASVKRDRSFRISPDYRLTVDGKDSVGSRIYESEGTVGFLVVSPDLPAPVLIDPRTRKYHLLDSSTTGKEAGKSFDLPSQPEFRASGDFEMNGGGIGFSLGGRQCQMVYEPVSD